MENFNILNLLEDEKNGTLASGNLQYLTKKEINSGITQSLKVTLVDWLLSIKKMLGLKNETIYLSICLLNWCVSNINNGVDIDSSNLQLFGLCCVMISSKKYEINYITIDD